MTRRNTIALAVALTTLAVWLVWAARQEGGAPIVLTTAGLWWLAALQATWRVWLPVGVVLAGLYASIPPRSPRRAQLRLVPAAAPPARPPTVVAAPAPTIASAPVGVANREPVQEPRQESPQVSVPASVPAPPRTVWQAFTPLHQEGDDDAAA